jgi:hypothetical protein
MLVLAVEIQANKLLAQRVSTCHLARATNRAILDLDPRISIKVATT